MDLQAHPQVQLTVLLFLINFHPSPSLPANAPAQVIVGIAKFTPHVFAFTADWANMANMFLLKSLSPRDSRQLAVLPNRGDINQDFTEEEE